RTGLFMFNPLCGLCELLFIFSNRKKTKLKEDAIKVIKLLYTPSTSKYYLALKCQKLIIFVENK
ncbi:MAG: hypothetical protein K8R58_00430, partial [Bacteroidales bacterium]|nr:hypothetical protein [Bacteroidales bacterium]